MATNPASRPKGRSIKSLRMVWGFALKYPGHIAVAALALLLAAGATSGVPYAFKLIIDKGFGAGGGSTRDIARWFEYLLFLVAVMAFATALRFYFVSWLGERTVADIRLAVHRNLLRMSIGEMIGFKSTPFPIVINEALEIARRYSAPESINFLNGMLDAIARSLLPK